MLIEALGLSKTIVTVKSLDSKQILKPSNDHNQVENSKGSSQHAVPVPEMEHTQTVNTSPLNDLADDRARAINKQMVEPPSDSIFIAGTTLDRGAPSITLFGSKRIALQDGKMVLGGLTTRDLNGGAHSGIPDRVTTTINGQAIIADSTALSIAHTIANPGAPPLVLSGTTVSHQYGRAIGGGNEEDAA